MIPCSCKVISFCAKSISLSFTNYIANRLSINMFKVGQVVIKLSSLVGKPGSKE